MASNFPVGEDIEQNPHVSADILPDDPGHPNTNVITYDEDYEEWRRHLREILSSDVCKKNAQAV